MAGEAAIVVESFDALASSRRLQQARFPMQQSDAIASELAGAISGLVTREHFDATLGNLDTRIDARFDKIDARFAGVNDRFVGVNDRFESLETRLRESQSRWAVTIIVVNLAALGLAVALLTFAG